MALTTRIVGPARAYTHAVSAHGERPIEGPVTFDNPPVSEVALAVQFAEPATDDASTLARFWPRIQNEFPQVQVQPALPPMSEEFRARSTLSFKFLDPAQRCWFLSENQAEGGACAGPAGPDRLQLAT